MTKYDERAARGLADQAWTRVLQADRAMGENA
jgi:hypothetical protein